MTETNEPTAGPRELVSDKLLMLWIDLQRRNVGSEQAARLLETMAQQLRGRPQ